MAANSVCNGEWKEWQEPESLVGDDREGDDDGIGEGWEDLGLAISEESSNGLPPAPSTSNSPIFPIADSVGVVEGHHFSPQTTRWGLINRKLAPMWRGQVGTMLVRRGGMREGSRLETEDGGDREEERDGGYICRCNGPTKGT
jgi:hypothetical protein